MLPTALAFGLFLAHPSWLVSLERWLFDRLTLWTAPAPASSGIAIVEIDDRSLAEFGRWPWPRSRTAALVETITARGSSTVALAMMFPAGARVSTTRPARIATGCRVV